MNRDLSYLSIFGAIMIAVICFAMAGVWFLPIQYIETIMATVLGVGVLWVIFISTLFLKRPKKAKVERQITTVGAIHL